MLIVSSGKCQICGSDKLPFTMQEALCTCQKCGKEYKVCQRCKEKGCPKCGGRLESSMEWATKNKILF